MLFFIVVVVAIQPFILLIGVHSFVLINETTLSYLIHENSGILSVMFFKNRLKILNSSMRFIVFFLDNQVKRKSA